MDFNCRKAFVTGGAGFIGSHVAEEFARAGAEVVVFDNLSRAALLNKQANWAEYNWNYLKKYSNVKLVKGDVLDEKLLQKEIEGSDVVVHCAAQTAVTTSLTEPRQDFLCNALGTFNVLEAARLDADGACFVYCSTNKVYGDNVNAVPVAEGEKRYSFAGAYTKGISEDFPTDASEHTPYGCSKLCGDAYARDYAKLYGLHTGVFRMSCVYGPRQFGVEDQGWLAHFVISMLKNKPLTIYGNGKQVRDVLYISDFVDCMKAFVERSNALAGEAFNIGGGLQNTLSLLELLELLEKFSSKRVETLFAEWRPADQKVYVSNISKATEKLGWNPVVPPERGVGLLLDWAKQSISEFD